MFFYKPPFFSGSQMEFLTISHFPSLNFIPDQKPPAEFWLHPSSKEHAGSKQTLKSKQNSRDHAKGVSLRLRLSGTSQEQVPTTPERNKSREGNHPSFFH